MQVYSKFSLIYLQETIAQQDTERKKFPTLVTCDPLTRSMPSTLNCYTWQGLVVPRPSYSPGKRWERLDKWHSYKTGLQMIRQISLNLFSLGSLKMQFQFQTSDSASNKGKTCNSSTHTMYFNLCCENDSALHLHCQPLSEQT